MIGCRAPALPICGGSVGVEVVGVPSQHAQQSVEIGARERRRRGWHAGQSRPPHAVVAALGADLDDAGAGVVPGGPGAVPLGSCHRRSDGCVAAEGHLGERAEVPDLDAVGALDQERRLREPHLGGDVEHPGIGESLRIEDHPGGIAARGIRAERAVADHIGRGFPPILARRGRHRVLDRCGRVVCDDSQSIANLFLNEPLSPGTGLDDQVGPGFAAVDHLPCRAAGVEAVPSKQSRASRPGRTRRICQSRAGSGRTSCPWPTPTSSAAPAHCRDRAAADIGRGHAELGPSAYRRRPLSAR